MIDIKSFGSGSSGNCYVISDGETKVMIEAGIGIKDIKQALNFDFSGLSCLVSHSHKDHCKSVKDIMNLGVDCYMSQATADEIGAAGHRVKTFETKKQFRIGTLVILPFDLQHDVENHGFLIQSDNGSKLLFITDSYYCKYKFSGITHLMLEINYSKEILDQNVLDGRVDKGLRKRIVASHMSLENALIFLESNDLSKVEEIHLLHLSNSNSDEALFKRKVQESTGKLVVTQ